MLSEKLIAEIFKISFFMIPFGLANPAVDQLENEDVMNAIFTLGPLKKESAPKIVQN